MEREPGRQIAEAAQQELDADAEVSLHVRGIADRIIANSISVDGPLVTLQVNELDKTVVRLDALIGYTSVGKRPFRRATIDLYGDDDED